MTRCKDCCERPATRGPRCFECAEKALLPVLLRRGAGGPGAGARPKPQGVKRAHGKTQAFMAQLRTNARVADELRRMHGYEGHPQDGDDPAGE